MKATDVIKRDHRAAEELFERFKKAKLDDQEIIAKEIFAALDTHEKMEDAHFYPALDDSTMKDDLSLKEIENEQTDLKMEVLATRTVDFFTDEGKKKIEKIMEKVLAHAQKEERIVLPMAEETLDAETLEELGEKMELDSAVANSK